MNLEMGEIKNGTYFKQWWQEMPAAPKKRWRVFLLGFSLFWLAGAAYAPTAVAGIARLTGLARLLMAVGMGGFGFLWGGLKGLGLIQETPQEPNLFWVVLALALPGAVFGFIYILDQAPNPLFNMQKMLGKFARSQGRLQDKEVAQELAIERGVPYATVTDDKKKEVKVGLDYASGEGHLLVSGPTRSGKGLHLTDTLLTWPGPALIVDPKGEQMARTAAWRSQFGSIYCLPGHQINLATYYRQLLDRDDVAELHTHLMRPMGELLARVALVDTAVAPYVQQILAAIDPAPVMMEEEEEEGENGRRVKGTIHWVSARHALNAELRQYDVLFNRPEPEEVDEESQDFTANLNPHSLEILENAKLEPGLKFAEIGESYQFMRQGYYAKDPDSSDDHPVFNLTVALRDSWAKVK